MRKITGLLIFVVLVALLLPACDNVPKVQKEYHFEKITYENSRGFVNEDMFIEEFEQGDGVYVLVHLTYDLLNYYDDKDYETVDEAQQALTQYRALLREHCYNKNLQIVSDLNIDSSHLTIDEYGPYLSFMYESYNDFLLCIEQFYEMTQYDDIDRIAVMNNNAGNVDDEAVIGGGYSTEPYYFADILEDLALLDETGEGIKVGIYESDSGIVDVNGANFVNRTITVKSAGVCTSHA